MKSALFKASPGPVLICYDLKRHTYMTVFAEKFLCHVKKPWFGSGFSNNLDLGPNSAKFFDPDLVNTDPKHCLAIRLSRYYSIAIGAVES